MGRLDKFKTFGINEKKAARMPHYGRAVAAGPVNSILYNIHSNDSTDFSEMGDIETYLIDIKDLGANIDIHKHWCDSDVDGANRTCHMILSLFKTHVSTLEGLDRIYLINIKIDQSIMCQDINAYSTISDTFIELCNRLMGLGEVKFEIFTNSSRGIIFTVILRVKR